MNLEMLLKSGNIIFETVAGSHAYGISTKSSIIFGYSILLYDTRIETMSGLREAK
jgi:hypothetical protein